VGARSDTGLVRSNNEDCFAVDLSLNLFFLCDGMGGQAAGEVASRLGVQVIGEHCRQAAKNPRLAMVGEYQNEFSPQTNRLASGIRLSNQAIHEAAERQASTMGMGSTVVAAQLNGNVLSVAHVGDSRLYLSRAGRLEQVTEDHSFVMEQVRRGLISREEAEQSEMANVIMRALGAEPTVAADLDELWMAPDDQVLLCSDGLTRMVPEAQMTSVLAEAPSAQQACDRLVELANEMGGEDNVTVIVVRLRASPSESLWGKLIRFFLGGDRAWPN
ncbi:MAG: Stp1/IreP family PP2C-type Ser/Thr phosphatase, partial [Acidobacteria bacterium]|nr:Stp1/IreP family PP2C-type Ser/Thr phosphatase [Acidobacteriota bacterium]